MFEYEQTVHLILFWDTLKYIEIIGGRSQDAKYCQPYCLGCFCLSCTPYVLGTLQYDRMPMKSPFSRFMYFSTKNMTFMGFVWQCAVAINDPDELVDSINCHKCYF